MMKKRLSKKIWYGSDVDSEGNPVLPPLAIDSDDLEGLHYGELYLHIADDKLSLWTRTLTDQVKQIGGLGGGGSFWKLMETENGEKYIFSDFDVVTQKGITTYADGGMLDLPSIYDGLPIDNQTIYWEEITNEDGSITKVLKAKGGGSGEGGGIEYPLTWSGYSSGTWDGSTEKNIYIPSKVSELSNDSAFITSSALNGYATESYVTSRGYITASALSDYLPLTGGTITGDLSVNGTLKSNIVRSIYNRLLIADNGTNIISIGGNYAGMITEFNGEKFKFWANGTEISVIDDNGVTVRKRIWCQHSVVALYFQSLEACETSANTTGHFRMGRFDESDGGFKMQFGGTGTTGTLQVIDQQWTKSLFKLDKSGNGDFAGHMTCRGNLNISGMQGVNTSINFYSYDNSGFQFSNRITESGQLRIYYRSSTGTFTSLFELSKTGNLLITGGITMYSDERKKTILNHVQLSLREVADAPLIEHYYNSDTEKTTHVGSIAQYWAGLNDWFCKMDADGFYTMEVQNAALASAISVARELLKYETKTDKQIRKLKKRISELEEEVELLKKM